MMNPLTCTFLVLLINISSIICIHYDLVNVEIQPYEEECFFEYVKENEKLFLRVQVIEGGFLDISFHDKYPNGTTTSKEKLTDNIVYADFSENGTYEYCLNNDMSSLTTKVVKLSIVIYTIQDQKAALLKRRVINVTTSDLVDELAQKFAEVGVEVLMGTSRQEIHHKLNDSTNSWVLWWAVFECLVILSMTLGQVYYIKRYFEIRRIV